MDEPETLQQSEVNYVRWRGRRLLYFAGCDYFRLAQHPAVLKAAADGLKKFGLNVAASRLTTGNNPVYADLETALARFFKVEAATLLASGYQTSSAVAQALAGDFTHALADARAHPALLDAARHLGCPLQTFKHREAEDFRRAVSACGPAAKIILLTDGMFSHDGSVAPLKAYLKILPRTGLLLVDDAHGAGILGSNDRGTPELAGIPRQRVVQCITLSKALGAYGGAVLGTHQLREKIFTRARLFVGNTPLPPPLAAAALQSVKILTKQPGLRTRLHKNSAYLKSVLRQAGFEISDTPGPIVPLHDLSADEIADLRKRLLKAGIYPSFLKYPGGATNGYYRFVISSAHTRDDLDLLASVLTDFKTGAA